MVVWLLEKFQDLTFMKILRLWIWPEVKVKKNINMIIWLEEKFREINKVVIWP